MGKKSLTIAGVMALFAFCILLLTGRNAPPEIEIHQGEPDSSSFIANQEHIWKSTRANTADGHLLNEEEREFVVAGVVDRFRDLVVEHPDPSSFFDRPSREEWLRGLDGDFDPVAAGERFYVSKWEDFVDSLELSAEDRSLVRNMMVQHEAHNAELSRMVRDGAISLDEFRTARWTTEGLARRLQSLLSNEQVESFWLALNQYVEQSRLRRQDSIERRIANGYTGILASSLANDLATVRAYLGSGADANMRPVDGSTSPLHNAASNGNVDMIRALVGAGAEVNWITTDEFRSSALQKAASKGHVEAIRILVEAGANLDYDDPEIPGSTALVLAAQHGYAAAVEELLTLGADVGGQIGVSALQYAIESGDTNMEWMLIGAGADGNALPVILARAKRDVGRQLGIVND